MSARDLVLVTATDSRPARLAEFRASAERLRSLWGESTRVVSVDSGSEILDALRGHGAEIARLAIVGHGGWSWLLHSGRGVQIERRGAGSIGVDVLAAELAARGAEDLYVALAACWTGADRPSALLAAAGGWAVDGSHYGPGGEGGLAAALRRWLVHHAAHGATVVAHSTRGHATRNPCLRQWGPGRRGASVLDLHHGEGSWRSSRVRAEWSRLRLPPRPRDRASVAGAERVIAGLALGA